MKKKELPQFKVGEWAKWESQAGGSTKAKVAECIAVIPGRCDPRKIVGALDQSKFSYGNMDACGFARDHESYLFALPAGPKGGKRAVYWPRVSALQKIDA